MTDHNLQMIKAQHEHERQWYGLHAAGCSHRAAVCMC